ncbi:MAG: cytochrome P450, partial [Planctomycetota bacterium]|nr:cytochrome P450 [Planctomycetota bacterium]
MELSPFNFWRRIEELHRRIQSLIAETLAPLAPASPLDVEADFFPPADIYTTDEYLSLIHI